MNCTNQPIGRLIARYELGALDPAEQAAFESHLIQCQYCHNEVYSMAPFMGALRKHREAVLRGEIPSDRAAVQAAFDALAPPQPAFWFRWPVLAAASVLIAVSIGLLALYLNQRSQPGPSEVTTNTSPTQVPKPEIVPPDLQMVLRGSKAFEQAMDTFRKNDFQTAVRELEVVSRLEPDNAEAHFYWGVSLLMLNRSQEAITPLKKAIPLSSGEQRENGHYYLALAYLNTNQPEPALTQLEKVIELNGPHRAEAEKLKLQIRP